jgi:hypothetical protein
MPGKKVCCCAAVFFLIQCAQAYASDHLRAEQSFPDFCKNWVATLNKYSQEHIACRQVDDAFIAEYTSCSNEFATEVKKPASCSNAFVGTLQFRETKYQSSAQSCEGARQGPFTLSAETNVTHIFLYKNGRWQY